MSASNGHGGPGAGGEVIAARPVVLVRYRPGVTGDTARAVRAVPLPTDGSAGAVGSVCGAALMQQWGWLVTCGTMSVAVVSGWDLASWIAG